MNSDKSSQWSCFDLIDVALFYELSLALLQLEFHLSCNSALKSVWCHSSPSGQSHSGSWAACCLSSNLWSFPIAWMQSGQVRWGSLCPSTSGSGWEMQCGKVPWTGPRPWLPEPLPCSGRSPCWRSWTRVWHAPCLPFGTSDFWVLAE